MNKNRKGFTIVELVIVIAIIAILAAVLIPTFASLIAKANVSVDTQLVRNLNNALTAEKAGGENNKTMYDALMMTKSAGYDIDTIVSKSGNNIAWDSKNDRFVLIDPNNNTYIYPTESGAGSQTIATPVDFFVIYNEVPAAQKYSIYLSKNATVTEANVTVGFDAGENTAVTALTYNRSAATEGQNVVIRTNSASTDLSINAPRDNVVHYDEVGGVEIIAVAPASYHESGSVSGEVTLSKGHFVVETGASLAQPITIKDTTGDVKVTTNEAVAVIVDSAVTTNVSIDSVDSSKPVYVDDRTTGNTVSKPENAVAVINLDSETAIANNSTVDSDGDYSLKSGFYKLTGNIKTSHQIYIEENQNVILDLNGCVFESTYAAYGLANYGTMTINDSSNDQGGIIFNSSDAWSNWSHDAIRNYGTLTINAGHFGDNDLDLTNANTSTKGAAVRNLGACTINGGFFTCVDNYGYFTSIDDIFSENLSSTYWVATESDGTSNVGYVVYKNQQDKTVKQNSYSYAIKSSGNMIINNATVYGAMNGGVAADAGHIEINGGSFTVSKTNTYYVVVNGSNGTTTINGGLFTRKDKDRLFGGFSGMPSWDATGNLASSGFVVNGGTFIVNGESITLN